MNVPTLSGRRWLAAAPLAAIAAVVVPATQAVAAPSVPNASTTPVTVANWQMNDGSDGVMHDSSGSGNDGTLENSVTAVSPPLPVSRRPARREHP